MKKTCERRLIGAWSLTLFIGSGLFIATCREKQEAPELVPIAPEPKPPIAREVSPPTENRNEAKQREAQNEITRGAAPADRTAPSEPAQPDAAGKDRGIVTSDVERFQGHAGYLASAGTRALLPRALRVGAGLGEGLQIRVGPEVTKDVVSKPLVPSETQQTYGGWNFRWMSDQSRRGQHFRVETGDAPAYSTMPPVTPDVSEDTVLPELQTGFP